jgi:VanZ family protein
VRSFLLLSIAVVVYGSLYPGHFAFTAAAGNPIVVLLHGWPANWTLYILRDIILNVIGYVPLGLAAFLALRRRHARGFAAGGAVALGYLLSVSMELLQVYLPGRVPSLLDVLTNTLGTAAGVAFALYFEAGIRRLAEVRAGHFRAGAMLLALLWAVSELYPLFPDISRSHLSQEWAMLVRYPKFSVVEIWGNGAEWFAAGCALDAIFARMRTLGLAAAMLCVPAQMFILDRLLTVPEIAGALLALALWRFLRREARARWAIWMLGSAILLRQLQPFYFLAVPQPFSWTPFVGTLESDRASAVVIITRKAFDYGALVWSLRYAGVPYAYAGLAVAAMLGVTEAIQTYLPGRTPEITDPMLALLMMLALAAVGRTMRKAA